MTRDEFDKKFFPDADCGREPLGNKITVQLLSVPTQSKGGIILAPETKDFNKQATTVAKVIKLGPIAYRDRNSGDYWKEGKWCDVGDYVLVNRYGGFNRIEIPRPDNPDDAVIFTTFNDFDVIDRITGQYEQYATIL